MNIINSYGNFEINIGDVLDVELPRYMKDVTKVIVSSINEVGKYTAEEFEKLYKYEYIWDETFRGQIKNIEIAVTLERTKITKTGKVKKVKEYNIYQAISNIKGVKVA